MKQSTYETIMACIQYGSAATAPALAQEFNETVNLANELVQTKLKAEQAARDTAKNEAMKENITNKNK